MKCVLGSTGYYEPSKVITGLDSFEKISDATGLNVLDLVNDPEGGASIAREILGIDEETALKVMGCAARVAGSRAMGMFNQDPNGCDDYYMRGDVIWSKE